MTYGPDEKEWQYDMTIFSEMCNKCIHFNDEEIFNRVCAAFPKGIPREIWMKKITHYTSYPGDHGIQFEKRTK